MEDTFGKRLSAMQEYVRASPYCGTTVPIPPPSVYLRVDREDRADVSYSYRSAAASADYSKALASLRRFYDYHFPSTAR
jgi:hypothetical protein